MVTGRTMSDPVLDYQAVEERVRAGYREASDQYRRDDELEVRTESHRRLAAAISECCLGFPGPIRVLDVGCGTGRFFHAVRNAIELVGIDISEEMLAAARRPVLAGEITVPDIVLECRNVYLTEFAPESFDFIYSIGMFGHGCPVTPAICDAMYSWLRPGGRLFFDVVDYSGLPVAYRVRRRARGLITRIAPGRLKARLDERERRCPFFPVTARELRAILGRTSITRFRLSSRACESPLWSGRHLELRAAKAP